MTPAVLVVLAAVGQQLPNAQANVDRASVEVGDDVTLTIQLEAYGSQSVEVVGQPPLRGLQLRGSRQSSSLNLRGGAGVRTTVWQYTLRAIAPGRGIVGPITLRAGVEEVTVDALSVEVRAVDEARRDALDTRIERIVRAARAPDGSDEVRVSVVPSPDSIVLGEQVDLVVVAWFPRDTRTRLRTRPTLTPPELHGAWSYARTSALGVVATQEVSGRVYDLFVHHQVVFPLTSGRLEVGPARVTFSLPLRQSILSREQPQEVESDPASVYVAEQPAAGRPANFSGAAASDVELTVQIDSGGFARGEVASVTATVRGTGNVALWPEPEFAWPPGLRVYQGNTSMDVEEGGAVSGQKTFSYVVAADSIGSFGVPSARFPYFDLRDQRYRLAMAEPFTLISRMSRSEEVVDVADVALMPGSDPSRAEQLVSAIPLWVWVTILIGPPVLGAAGLVISRWRRRARSTVTEPTPALGSVARDFRVVLRSLVEHAELLNRDQLSAALQAAGVDVPLAVQAARVRDRIQQSEYGPPLGIDADELQAEVTEIIKALPRPADRSRGFVHVTVIALMLANVASPVHGQTPTAEQLFDAGGFEQAADSFARRTIASPSQVAHWFNLGAALYSSGRAPEARAAWLHAARLDPRNGDVLEALEQLPVLDAESQRLAWVAPLTFSEALIVTTIVWLVGWSCLVFRWRRLSAAMLTVAIVGGVYCWYVRDQYRGATALVIQPNTPLREAPYGPAPPTRLLNEDMTVRVLQSDSVWALIERSGFRGWLLETEIARI